MRYVGRLFNWNDARGFGFVEPNGGGERAFVHVKAVESRQGRLQDGDLISYEVQRGERGLVAKAIRKAGVRPTPADPPARPSRPLPLSVTALYTAALATGFALDRVPWSLIVAQLALSFISFLMYAADKAAAERNRWRVPEANLQLVALIGGWPGALIAQHAFRHKSSKHNFQGVFRVVVVLSVAAVAYLAWSGVARSAHASLMG